MKTFVIFFSELVLIFAVIIIHGCDRSTDPYSAETHDAPLFKVHDKATHDASIIVNTTDDELNFDGDCSLREAIQAANSDTAVDACTAGSGADIIIVPAGTYILSIAGRGEDANATGDLDITADLTINGEGAAATIIDASELDRVFHIISGTVLISRMAVVNGQTFGGNAGGIQNEGTLTVRDGGGIQNMLTLTVIHSTVSGNVSDFGGGIQNSSNGTLTIIGSTVSGNMAEFGGGLSNLGTTATLINSTISGNTASDGGGGMDNSGTLELINCTVSTNTAPVGGGIFNFGVQATLTNTIVAGNISGGDCNGTITSLGHNLDSDGSCVISGVNDDITSASPALGPLQNNGGPTETHALLFGSPAVNAGDCSGGTIITDQRGVHRPMGTDCDIGAFEKEADRKKFRDK